MPCAEQAEERDQLRVALVLDDRARAAQVLLGEAVDHHRADGAAGGAFRAVHLHTAATVAGAGAASEAGVILGREAQTVLDVGACGQDDAGPVVGLLVEGDGPGTGPNGGIGGAGVLRLVARKGQVTDHAAAVHGDDRVQLLTDCRLDRGGALQGALEEDPRLKAQRQGRLDKAAGADVDLRPFARVGRDVGVSRRHRGAKGQEWFALAGPVVAVAGCDPFRDVEGAGVPELIQPGGQGGHGVTSGHSTGGRAHIPQGCVTQRWSNGHRQAAGAGMAAADAADALHAATGGGRCCQAAADSDENLSPQRKCGRVLIDRFATDNAMPIPAAASGTQRGIQHSECRHFRWIAGIRGDDL